MTSLSAPLCMTCRAYHLEVAEPIAAGVAVVGILIDVPFGSFHRHRSDLIRDAWARVETGMALKGGRP